MHTKAQLCGCTRAGASFVVSLMFALWLQVLGLGLSPHFHEWLHTDAQSESHECPVTLLSKGNLISELASAITVPVPLHAAPAFIATDNFLLLLQDYRLSPSRAPPTC